MKTGYGFAAALAVCVLLSSGPVHGQDMNGGGARVSSVDFAIQLIYSGDGADKYYGIGVLEASGRHEPQVLDAIVSCLFEGTMFQKRYGGRTVNRYWDVRNRAAQALGNIGDDYALSGLHRALLYEPDPVIKSTIVTAIGKIGSSESIPNLSRVVEEASVMGYGEARLLRACIGAVLDIGAPEGYWTLYYIEKNACNMHIRHEARDALRRLEG